MKTFFRSKKGGFHDSLDIGGVYTLRALIDVRFETALGI